MLTTSAGIVLGGEYRQRFSNGVVVNDGSIEAGSGSETETVGSLDQAHRPCARPFLRQGRVGSHRRCGAPDTTSSARADQTYMLRYHFPTPADYLSSNLHVEDFGPNSYGNITAYAFQSLNPAFGNSVEPMALPQASYEWTSDADAIGGRWHAGGERAQSCPSDRARGAPPVEQCGMAAAVQRHLAATASISP